MKKAETPVLSLVLASLLVAPPVQAEKISLEKMPTQFSAANVFDLDPAKAPPRKGGLMEMKWKELRGEWTACRALGEKLQKTAKDVEPWVARSRLECSLKEFDPKKPATTSALSRSVAGLKISWLREGPWKDSLKDLWFRGNFELIKNDNKKNPAPLKARLEDMLEQQDLLSKDQRAQLLAQYAETVRAKDPEQALFLYQQSSDLKPDATVSARIAELERPKTITPVPAETEATRATPPAMDAEPLGAEAQTDREISTLLAQGQKVDAAKLMVQLLNRFPNGRFSRRDRERLPQMLLSAVDRNAESEAEGLRDVMKDADATRLADWALLLHRRGEDRGALQFAEKALETQATSPAAASLLWVAGRASQFQGDNDKAIRFFDRLVQFHPTTDEAAEALFRLALVEIRQGHFATAAKTLDKLIALDKDKWGVNARYWRIRSLEKTDPTRFEAEREDMLRRFPFTYYGLRLRAEKDGGQLSFPKNDRSPLETGKPALWFVGAQKKAWTRFQKLSSEGWLLEAQAELSQLPAPSEPWALLEWAKVLAKAGQHPQSIQFVNKALDQEESLRHPRYLEIAYPRTYSRFIDEEAKKYGLEPVLVRSLIRQESAFGLKAVSVSNALGLMQLIPPTAKEVASELKMKVSIPEDLFRPEVNVPMGSYYISKMLKQFNGTIPMALAAYNAGPTRVNAWLKARPEVNQLRGKAFESWQDELWYDELPWTETSFYVKAILRNVLIDRLVDQGRVVVTPAFWTDLRADVAGNINDEAKRR